MKMSDLVAEHILQLLEECGGNAEIRRNELAESLGCVPSQINYVITSRFTPEQGYLVESRRGGGGYIRITRISADPKQLMRHVIHSLGNSLSAASAQAVLENMACQGMLTQGQRMLMAAALSDRAYGGILQEQRDRLRASLLKQMLMTLLISEE